MWTTLIARMFGGVIGYVAVGAISAVLAGGSVGVLVSRLADAKYEALQLKDAKAATTVAIAQAEAVGAEKDREIAQAKAAGAQAVAEARAQDALHVKIQTVVKEIKTYVHDAPVVAGPAGDPVYLPCIPNSVIRVLNAAIGDGFSPVDPAEIGVTTGQPDDACAAIAPSDFARQLAENFGVAEQNAEQLNSLEASITDLVGRANE